MYQILADSSSGQYKPDTIQALLQTGAHEMEEQTEVRDV